MMLIDTHCHLADKSFDENLDEVINEAEKAGLSKIIVPSIGIRDLKKALSIADRHKMVYVLAGIHPEVLINTSETEIRDEWLMSGGNMQEKLIEELNNSTKVVGIGEIGLDFYHDKEKISKKLQIEVFKSQLLMAVNRDLPVAIHMRSAETEMKEVLTNIGPLPRGQFHCWSGSDEFLETVLTLGFHISFCGNITYKSATTLREQLKKIPLERLLLETDSPYLSPEPSRGRQNKPSNVKILASYIANLRGTSAEEVIKQTTINAECLYFPG